MFTQKPVNTQSLTPTLFSVQQPFHYLSFDPVSQPEVDTNSFQIIPNSCITEDVHIDVLQSHS